MNSKGNTADNRCRSLMGNCSKKNNCNLPPPTTTVTKVSGALNRNVNFDLSLESNAKRKLKVIKALRKTVFTKIFVFASFGNCHFPKIRVGMSFSSFFRNHPDLQKTRSDSKLDSKVQLKVRNAGP